MACFLVSAAEAVAVTAATKVAKKKAQEAGTPYQAQERITFCKKLKWLSNMLWGGSALLAFEHLWHGEITPWFPFLTAMKDPSDAMGMLVEMGTVGVLMAALITAAWGCMVFITNTMEKKALQSHTAVQ